MTRCQYVIVVQLARQSCARESWKWGIVFWRCGEAERAPSCSLRCDFGFAFFKRGRGIQLNRHRLDCEAICWKGLLRREKGGALGSATLGDSRCDFCHQSPRLHNALQHAPPLAVDTRARDFHEPIPSLRLASRRPRRAVAGFGRGCSDVTSSSSPWKQREDSVQVEIGYGDFAGPNQLRGGRVGALPGLPSSPPTIARAFASSSATHTPQ